RREYIPDNSMKKLWVILLLFLVASLLPADDLTVYITKIGKKYHLDTCSYLRSSKIPISLADAIVGGYTPCSRCNPPSQTQEAKSAFELHSIEELAIPYCADPAQIQHYVG
ncbi:unnamed protein product, partial [marine sediment metagenome]